MKTLLIDAGNSHLKWSILDHDKLSKLNYCSYKTSSASEVFKELVATNGSECKSIIMVSVLGDEFAKMAQRTAENLQLEFNIVRSNRQLAGITNAYSEPHKLGSDRLVGMIAAHHISREKEGKAQACIVVDSGTATTIDAIDTHGQHLGGIIMLGLESSSASLLKNTELLPLWNKKDEVFKPSLFSQDTSQAIASGCLLGLAGGIDSICNSMEEQIIGRSDDKLSRVKRVICGGAAEQLIPHLQASYEHHENLLMFGLKIIKEAGSANV